METFTPSRPLVDNPDYYDQRRDCLAELDIRTLDAPIAGLIGSFADLTYCFPLQSCYGHFLHSRHPDPYNLEPLPPPEGLTTIEYRIAYIALCIENSESGKELLSNLKRIPSIDPEYIQFGCAEWFWERQVNSYALQVEPERFKMKDRVCIDYQEALHLEKIRNRFFEQLKDLLKDRLDKNSPGQ